MARSPYLLGICAYILLLTTTATFLYFEQQHIVAREVARTEDRTSLFALIDLLVNVLTLALQTLVTGRLMRRFGVGVVLVVLPVLTVLGFGALALAPTVMLIVAVQGVRRASKYALARPAREVLFTVVSREEKYKAKNVIDTLCVPWRRRRGGVAFAGFRALGTSLSGIAPGSDSHRG